MQQNRSRTVWFIAIAVAFFFFIDPFNLFSGSKVPQYRVAGGTMREMVAFLESAPEPSAMVVDLLQSADVVLIGETGFVHEQVEVISGMVDDFDRAGIRVLGYHFANAADQGRLDDLVTGVSFDEELARDILFSHLVVLGYQEHVELLRSVWQVNRAKAAGEAPFRVIGINASPDYSHLAAEEELQSPAVMQRVFAGGVPDELMAAAVAEILDAGQKAVVYTQLLHALTTVRSADYATKMAALGFPGQERMGNALEARYPARVATVLLHGPLANPQSPAGFSYPAGGVVDQAFRQARRGPAGFIVADSPFADAPAQLSSVLADDTERDLAAVTDGWRISLRQSGEFTPLTAIEGFITEDRIERARAQFPGADPGEVSVEEMNQYIAESARSMERVFREFAR